MVSFYIAASWTAAVAERIKYYCLLYLLLMEAKQVIMLIDAFLFLHENRCNRVLFLLDLICLCLILFFSRCE